MIKQSDDRSSITFSNHIPCIREFTTSKALFDNAKHVNLTSPHKCGKKNLLWKKKNRYKSDNEPKENMPHGHLIIKNICIYISLVKTSTERTRQEATKTTKLYTDRGTGWCLEESSEKPSTTLQKKGRGHCPPSKFKDKHEENTTILLLSEKE